ncbi:MAG TPA: ribonuclease E activity regulator RraA [Symbiobacteriaceae bacterium]|nr:ribonuclease E activity regulator RraA [Symbiobacteriaceae bacterium]
MKTTDLCDQFGAELQVCAPMLRHFGKTRDFCGPIATVKVFEDNALVKEALQTVPAGSVLVVDGGGSLRSALVGDMLAGLAVERGLAGIIVNGCIRDAAEIANLDVGVMALASNPLRSSKLGAGERDLPVQFGGVSWAPGQWAYADEDGVVVANRPLHL